MNYIYRNNQKKIQTEENCLIQELLNDKTHGECSIAEARVEVGESTQLHALKNTIERYVILHGEGIVEIGHDFSDKVKNYDVVSIPVNTAQKITNTGKEPLIFLCICTPRFEQQNYINLEMASEYQPVSCDIHSQLELAIIKNEIMTITYIKSNKKVTMIMKPKDIFIKKDKGEFLLTEDAEGIQYEIRLDQLLSFKNIKSNQ